MCYYLRMQMCSVEGCSQASRVNGWCPKHYARWLRHGDVSVVKRSGRPRIHPPYVPHPRPTRYADCHPDRKHAGRGLCRSCLSSEHSRARQLRVNACANHSDRLGGKRGLCPECVAVTPLPCGHIALKAARGMCGACYKKRPGYAHHIPPAMWQEYVGERPTCDVCGTDQPGRISWNIDHAHDCATGHLPRYGCQECVRANLCHGCNAAEGVVRRLVDDGLMDIPVGPFGTLFGPLSGTPFQRWLRERETPGGASLP